MGGGAAALKRKKSDGIGVVCSASFMRCLVAFPSRSEHKTGKQKKKKTFSA